MKKLMWIPTVCFGLALSACGTNNDGLQNYASNDYKTTNTNPYRNMNMYQNGGADVYRTHMNSLRPQTGADFGDQRTYLLRSGTNVRNNQAINQYGATQNYNRTNWGTTRNAGSNIVGINGNGVNNGASNGTARGFDTFTGYGTSYDQGYNMRYNRLSLFGGNNNGGARNFSAKSTSAKIGFAQASGQSAQSANGVYVDRDLMASYIANLVNGIPYVDGSTVLVTDDHVFINVETRQKNRGNGKQHLNNLHNQVRKQALSVTPRYYKIRVSSDEASRQRLIQSGHQGIQSTDDIENKFNNQNNAQGKQRMTR